MLGLAIYIGLCAGIAAILTFIVSLVRPVKAQGDFRSWRLMGILFVLCLLVPFGISEGLTAAFGGPLESAVKQGVAEAGVKGKFEYYRISSWRGEHAEVLAVVTEHPEWGGRDRVVVKVGVTQREGRWLPTSAYIMSSNERFIDRLTIPPYR